MLGVGRGDGRDWRLRSRRNERSDSAMVGPQVIAAPIFGEAAIRAFRVTFAGQVLTPTDDGYEEARKVWNGAIDRRPALIARCVCVTDIVQAVAFARANEVVIAVRGGGHNVAGMAVCDGGMVIDLSPMNAVRIDPVGQQAWAQPGVLWGEFDRATRACGLAPQRGACHATGVAGLTLGGGIGWAVAEHGLTIDNLHRGRRGDGRRAVLQASEDENADCSGACAVVAATSASSRHSSTDLHAVSTTVLAGPVVLYPLTQAQAVLRFYRDFVAAAPDELTTILNLRRRPARCRSCRRPCTAFR